MDRLITNIGESIYEWMLSAPGQKSMVAIAKLAAAMFGTNTTANGLSCAPTSPASLQVVVNPGEIYSLANLEASACGTLPVDSTHQILKQGILLDAFTTSTLAAPGTAGQSINYLIEAQYADSDVSIDPTTSSSPVVLQFYNSTNPTQPFSGPGGNGQTSTTFRKGIVSLQVKAGAAATTGTQTTPSPDAGWVGLWVVTVANGQSTITSGNIAQYSGAPILPSSLLSSIQSGNLSYAVATGTANAHVVALNPALTGRVDGMVIRYKAPAANTGAVTLNDGVGTVQVLGGNHAALQGGEYIQNGDAFVVWNSSISGGAYILVECTGGALQIAPATQSQHAVQLGQVSNTYAVRGLTGQNNATTPTTQYDVSCNLVVLRNPTLGNTQAVSNPGTITNNISTAGPIANGRDQASAFPASNWVHLYYIWNGTTLATISSLTAPPTGPALPNGYTHWAYIGAIILTASSTLNSVHMRGSRMRYDGTQNAVVGGSATTQTAVGLNPLIPPNALMFTLSIRELAGSADGTGKLDLVLHLGVISGSDYDAKHFGIAGVTSGTSQFSAPGTVDMPNVGQNYYYYMTQANGTGPSTTHLVLGYTVPNGDA